METDVEGLAHRLEIFNESCRRPSAVDARCRACSGPLLRIPAHLHSVEYAGCCGAPPWDATTTKGALDCLIVDELACCPQRQVARTVTSA
jgi:hypothetical protein